MEDNEPSSQAREQMLRVAESLFIERGYTAVTLKDIAEALGVRQAALYYHVPQGKEQLFVEVTRRNFLRHHKGLTQALEQAKPHLPAQLKSMALWLLSQPPLDLVRLARSDLPVLSKEHAQELYDLGQSALEEPVKRAITQAYERGEMRFVDAQVMTTLFLTAIDSVHEMHRYKGIAKEVLAQDVIEILLNGVLRR